MPTSFPQRARREDPHGHMIVQQNLEFLRDVVDGISGKSKGGQATIPNGATSVVVNHGLSNASYQATVVPMTNPGGAYWISSKTPVQFTINLAVAAPPAGVTFDWTVKGA